MLFALRASDEVFKSNVNNLVGDLYVWVAVTKQSFSRIFADRSLSKTAKRSENIVQQEENTS